MNMSEFSDRTQSFLSKAEIDRYEEDFEPAYMECEVLNKDEFCSAIRDEVVRRIAESFSRYVLRARQKEKYAEECLKEMIGQRDAAEERVNRLEKCIALVQSTCDRAMAGKERDKT